MYSHEVSYREYKISIFGFKSLKFITFSANLA